MTSEYRGALVRSFASEKRLISNHDPVGLWLKYRADLPDGSRYRQVLAGLMLKGLKGYSSVHIETEYGPYVSGWLDNGHKIGLHDSRVISLHLTPFNGAEQLRNDLADAAASIRDSDSLNTRQFVMGATYSEMARLAMRSGFHRMEIEDSYEFRRYDIQAAHLAFCAINGLNNDFNLAAVYMPTADFVAKFSGSDVRVDSTG